MAENSFRGSFLRGGNSLTNVGIDGGTWSPGVNLTPGEFDVSEPGTLRRLTIPEFKVDGSSTRDLEIASLQLDGGDLIAGRVPASIFWESSQINPLISRRINTNRVPKIQGVDAVNSGINTRAQLECGGEPPEEVPPMLAAAGATAQVIAAASETEYEIRLPKAMILGQLGLSRVASSGGYPVTVRSISVANDPTLGGILNGQSFDPTNPTSPWFGHRCPQGTVLKIVIGNADPVNQVRVGVGFTSVPWAALPDEEKIWLLNALSNL